MPSVEALLGFALATLILVVIPGPSVLFAVARSLSLGRTAGVVTVLGNTFGQVPLILAVAFGVGAIIAGSAVLFTTIKLFGAAYLVFLGVQAIRHRNRAGAFDPGEVPTTSSTTLRTIFWQGFLVGVSNPKSIVFFLAVLPQFVRAQSGAAATQMMVLGAVFIVVALISDGCYVLLAGTAREWFVRSPKRLTAAQTTGGVLMIGLGGALAFAGRQS